ALHQRPRRSPQALPAAHSGRSDHRARRLGAASLHRRSGHHDLGRPERVRRLLESAGNRAGRHEIPGLVESRRIVGVVGLSVRRTLYARRGADGGWTLIELLVVRAIILILASLARLQDRHAVTRAEEAAPRSDLLIRRDRTDQYYPDKGPYPAPLGTLVTARSLRSIPKDPITDSPDTWQTTQADTEPGMLSTQAGIYNVKSGSPDTALDG